jgi:hypothetical protein
VNRSPEWVITEEERAPPREDRLPWERRPKRVTYNVELVQGPLTLLAPTEGGSFRSEEEAVRFVVAVNDLCSRARIKGPGHDNGGENQDESDDATWELRDEEGRASAVLWRDGSWVSTVGKRRRDEVEQLIDYLRENDPPIRRT